VRRALLLYCGLLLAGSPVSAQELVPALEFAERLFAEGDYYRAITEYKRVLFLLGDAPRGDWVRLRIGTAYLEGNRPEAAARVFASLAGRGSDEKMRGLAELGRARAWYRAGRHLQGMQMLERLHLSVENPLLLDSRNYLLGCAALRAGHLEVARPAFAAVRAQGALGARAGLVLERLGRAGRLPERSPLLAGLLSLVPGLGHFYLGQVEVGITALLWNGLFGWASYDSFRRGQRGAGGVLLVLEMFWYAGTVYGAVAGAHRFNRDARLNFLEELDAAAGLDVEVPPRAPPLELGLRGRF